MLRKPAMTAATKKILEECAGKPRNHLGSQLYTTELSCASFANTSADSKIKFSSRMRPIPVFADSENCTFTVRVPRYYLITSARANGEYHSLEEICRRRRLWGTEIYTDDSDVIAAAVHSGWLKGDFGDFNDDLQGLGDHAPEQEGDEEVMFLSERPLKPVTVPDVHDAHITLLVLPPLEAYVGSNQNHIWSREWKQKHDGMSYMIHSIEFVDEGASNRFTERGAAARKHRIAMEDAARREAAAGLLMFAAGGNGTVRVGA